VHNTTTAKEHKGTYDLCHGDHLASARFGSVGGLSQPCRETADPKESVKSKKEKSVFLFPLPFYFFLSCSTPCDRAISIAELYPIQTS